MRHAGGVHRPTWRGDEDSGPLTTTDRSSGTAEPEEGAVAELAVEGDELVLHLTRAEKLEAVHGDLRVPRSAVTTIEVLDDAHEAADLIGVKIGTRIPGVVEVATVHGRDRTVFAAVHRATPRGVRVVLSGADHDEWIVGCADPEAVATRLRT